MQTTALPVKRLRASLTIVAASMATPADDVTSFKRRHEYAPSTGYAEPDTGHEAHGHEAHGQKVEPARL